ncbi:hypothetical protein [Geobacillus thermoleovorans]|uniref:hypothetical protein n=1 Tax=Geobacillus thermoleovorans TaxID=33941 RepID=UPI000ACE2E3E|nr:hypothetical protein [Geobacillus thermoleovorans]
MRSLSSVYRGEILLQRAETFVRALYHIVTPEGSEIVSEERYFAEQDDCHPDEVRLLIENHYDGLVVCYGCKCVILNYATFYLLLYSERLLARGHP